MNILEYIDELMEQGMSEDDAARCADIMFNDDWEPEHDDCYEVYVDEDGEWW